MNTTLNLLTIAMVSIVGTLPASAADQQYGGTLYRNGGHFGTANSDVSLEPDTPIVAGAPSSEIVEPADAPTPLWSGTLYRNGGHYGLENSEHKLSIDP